MEKRNKKIPKNIKNPRLYKRAREEADNRFGTGTSAYKSMWLSKRYKDIGGTYTTKTFRSTLRWRREKWIQVTPYVSRGEIVSCGDGGRGIPKACRPLKRVSKETPITIDEVIKKWGKRKVLQLAKKKEKDMKGRVMWGAGKFIRSY